MVKKKKQNFIHDILIFFNVYALYEEPG